MTAVTMTKDETIRLQAAEIERLRNGSIFIEQAAELTRLRAEVERLRDDRDSWAQQADDRVKDCEGFIAEIERLRSVAESRRSGFAA